MKILVIDDHPLVVDALVQLLPQIDPAMEVRAAMDPREAITDHLGTCVGRQAREEAQQLGVIYGLVVNVTVNRKEFQLNPLLWNTRQCCFGHIFRSPVS